MSLTQTPITISDFADMLEAAGPEGVVRTHYPCFDVHTFVVGPSHGAVVVEDFNETYVMLSQ